MYTPQSLEYYLSKCRYYHGGDLMDNEIWGGYEKRWIEFHFEEGGIEFLRETVKCYKEDGLGDFLIDDGTPLALKAILWSRYVHWVDYNPDGFKRWYMFGYLQIRPLNKYKKP